MLSRSRRMTAGQLDQIMEKGRVFHSSLFVMRVMPGQTETKVAAVAPQKVFRTAAVRNSLRRKIYAAIRPILVKLSSPTHLAVFAKQNAREIPMNDISSDLKALFVKAGILR